MFERALTTLVLLIVLLTGFASCAPYKPASRDPMTGFQAAPGERPNPEEEPTYKPNPDFDSFVPSEPSKNPPPPEERPAELPIIEQEEVEQTEPPKKKKTGPKFKVLPAP